MSLKNKVRTRTRRRLYTVVVGVIVSLLSSVLLGAGVASADNPYATPYVRGAANNSNPYLQSDGLKTLAIYKAKGCTASQVSNAEAAGKAFVRVVNANPNDGGKGTIIARADVTNLDSSVYGLAVVEVSIDANNVPVGCTGDQAFFRVLAKNQPVNPNPVVKPRVSAGSKLYQVVVVPRGAPVTQSIAASKMFWGFPFDEAPSGH